MNRRGEGARAVVIETERLRLRHFSLADAEFVHELVNDREFVRFIGDKGVRTIEDAREYLRSGPLASYERFGYGLYLVGLKRDGTKIGMCGLVKRDVLEHADVGYAFLPQFRSRGYALEAASAVLAYARQCLGMTRVAGIVKPDNLESIRLLKKLGLKLEGTVRIGDEVQENELFGRDM